jgi:hypothetical protein
MYYLVRWYNPETQDNCESIQQDLEAANKLADELENHGMQGIYIISERELSRHDADLQ